MAKNDWEDLLDITLVMTTSLLMGVLLGIAVLLATKLA